MKSPQSSPLSVTYSSISAYHYNAQAVNLFQGRTGGEGGEGWDRMVKKAWKERGVHGTMKKRVEGKKLKRAIDLGGEKPEGRMGENRLRNMGRLGRAKEGRE